VTLGWNLAHTAADELFAAVEGTAFHTRIILERMAEHGVPVHRVINAGGIPRKSDVLNRVYANALGTPILVPKGDTTSLGSAIFAFLAAGTFRTVEDAQNALCPGWSTIEPDARGSAISQDLYGHFRALYAVLGGEDQSPVPPGDILPSLVRITAEARQGGE
jgi:L-ribulokinase